MGIVNQVWFTARRVVKQTPHSFDRLVYGSPACSWDVFQTERKHKNIIARGGNVLSSVRRTGRGAKGDTAESTHQRINQKHQWEHSTAGLHVHSTEQRAASVGWFGERRRRGLHGQSRVSGWKCGKVRFFGRDSDVVHSVTLAEVVAWFTCLTGFTAYIDIIAQKRNTTALHLCSVHGVQGCKHLRVPETCARRAIAANWRSLHNTSQPHPFFWNISTGIVKCIFVNKGCSVFTNKRQKKPNTSSESRPVIVTQSNDWPFDSVC